MSAYTPEPAALDERPLLPTAYAAHVDDDEADGYAIKTGAWDASLFDCCDSWVNCCTVWWLPFISLSQISQRIGWAPYWKVLFGLLAIYVVEIVLASITVFNVHALHDASTDAQLQDMLAEHPQLLVVGSIFSLGFSACSFLGSFAGLVMILITLSLRGRVRDMFAIPGSTIDDAVASLCCSPCTVAQMATHVKSYKKGSCNIGPVDTLPGYGELPRYTNIKSGAARKDII